MVQVLDLLYREVQICCALFCNIAQFCGISDIIIQQIVTMPIYGKEALNICHPT